MKRFIKNSLLVLSMSFFCLFTIQLYIIPLLCIFLINYLVKEEHSNLQTFALSYFSGWFSSVVGISIATASLVGGLTISIFAIPFITIGSLFMVLFK